MKSKLPEGQTNVTILNIEHLDRNFLFELGRFTASFSYLELQLKLLCNNMVGGTIAGNGLMIMTSEFSFRQLLKVAKSLLMERRMYEKAKPLLKRLDKLNEERNELIHSFYGVSNGGKSMMKLNYKNASAGFIIDIEEKTIEDVKKFTAEMKDKANALSNLSLEVIMQKNKTKDVRDGV